jgi:nitrous oxidase accessory protein NosD
VPRLAGLVPQNERTTNAKLIVVSLVLVAGVAALASAALLQGDEAPAPGCTRFAGPVGEDDSPGTWSRPFETAQRLVSSLEPGETGCLRGGRYRAPDGGVVEFDRGGRPGRPITLRSYPGERATLVGILTVQEGANHVTLAALDVEGTGDGNTVKIYAADVVVEDSTITNLRRGDSCMILGSNSGDGQATRVVVRRNVFHDCGNKAHDNKDHGIYAQNVLEGEILGNVFWNSAAYAIQLYPNAQRTRFAHNVVDGDAPSVRGGVLFGGDGDYSSSDNVVERNVIAYAQTYNVTSTWSGAVGSGNVARDNCLWAGTEGEIQPSEGGFTAEGNTVADPLFVNRSGRDYRLRTDSPCLEVVGYDAAARLRSPPDARAR